VDPIIENSTEKSLIRHKRISKVFTSYLLKEEERKKQIEQDSNSHSGKGRTSKYPEIIQLSQLSESFIKAKTINISNKSLKKISKETSLSRRIIELRMKKWIFITLLLIIINFVIDGQWLNKDSNSYQYLANFIDHFSNQNATWNTPILLRLLEQNKQISIFPIINVTIFDDTLYINESMINSTYRKSELAYDQGLYNGNSLITYSVRTKLKYLAYIGLIRSFVIMMILFLFFFKFKNDIKSLVVDPLEIMIKTVEKIAKDPINANNIKDLEQAILNISKKKKRREFNNNGDIMYEIETIRSSITKISRIMISVLGDSGCEIIKHNLNINQEITYYNHGRRVYGVFGFCEIRNFLEINECLQEDAVLLVNEIAEIVHRIVYIYGGAINKNFGEQFLVIWKIKSKDVTINKKGILLFNKESEDLRFICDQAMIAFLSILIEINNSPKILKYMKNEKIIKKIKNFKVKMGFGLHIGWAIEGTVGSTFKIEASYVGAYVNMAAKLNSATKVYGVSILFSDDIFELLSPEIREHCRMIDRVKIKGLLKPVVLYTVEVNLDLTVKKDYVDFMLIKDLKKELIGKKENIEIGISLEGSIGKYVLLKNSFRELLSRNKPETFYSLFLEGLNLYLSGKWNKAFNLLKQGLELLDNGTDGPTVTLMNYMKRFKLIAPMEWNSFRVLNSK
jgi:class 3 adenylate cyclase